MADVKISALPASTTPLAGTEVLPIVQSSTTRQVSVANLTAGRAVSALSITASSLTSGRVTYAGTAGLLQDSANLTFDGTNLTTGGSETAARFIPSDSTVATNGMYLPAANTLGFSTNSTERMRIASGGLVSITGAGTEVLALNKSGGPAAYLQPVSSTDAGLQVKDSGGAVTLTVGTSGTTLALQGGTVSSGTGITFPATQSASSNANTLDDYEEGTWTATLSVGTNNATMGGNTCSYTKIGRTVTFSGLVATTSVSGLSGALRLTGLPFSVQNNSYSYGGCACTYATGMVLVAGQAITAVTESNSTYLTLYKWSAIAGTETLQDTNWSNTGQLLITGTYLTT
jgi:hypothetical protein